MIIDHIKAVIYEICAVGLRLLLIPVDNWKVLAAFELFVEQGIYPKSAYETLKKEIEEIESNTNGA